MLDKKSIKFLKLLKRNEMDEQQAEKRFGHDHIIYLVQGKYIKRTFLQDTPPGGMPISRGYAIDVRGKAFLNELKVSNIRFWIPVAISILALAVGAIGWFLPVAK